MSLDDHSSGTIALHGPGCSIINYAVVATLQLAAERLEKGDRDGALHLLSQVSYPVETAPDEPASMELIGVLVFFCKVLIKCGLPEKAMEVFADISRYNDLSDPASLETAGDYCQIGQLFLDHGNQSSAKTAFQKAKESLSACRGIRAIVYLTRVKKVLKILGA